MNSPFAAPEGHCPKCIAPCSLDALVCARCGLAFINFDLEHVAPRPPLDALWKELLAQWEDAEAHRRFLGQAALTEQLPAAARLYQIRCVQLPQDQKALAGREEVLKRVSLLLSTARSPAIPAARKRTLLLAAGAVILGLIAFSLFVFWGLHR